MITERYLSTHDFILLFSTSKCTDYFYIFIFNATEQLGGSSEDHFSLVFHVLDTESNEHTAQSGNNRLGFGLTYEVVVLIWIFIYLKIVNLCFYVSKFPNAYHYFH